MNGVNTFIEACRKKGLNVTYQRILIYKALINARSHPTAEDIYKEVKAEYPSISLATVYKTLETLSDHGLLSKVTELHDLARYDADVDLHHHLLCVNCKKLVDVDEAHYNSLPLPKQTDFNIQGYKILFEGICPECIRIEKGQSDEPDAEPVTFCGKSQMGR